jgi:hypothetical protein
VRWRRVDHVASRWIYEPDLRTGAGRFFNEVASAGRSSVAALPSSSAGGLDTLPDEERQRAIDALSLWWLSPAGRDRRIGQSNPTMFQQPETPPVSARGRTTGSGLC